MSFSQKLRQISFTSIKEVKDINLFLSAAVIETIGQDEESNPVASSGSNRLCANTKNSR
jgi:hypothetical protein